jgi:hypothetical protein
VGIGESRIRERGTLLELRLRLRLRLRSTIHLSAGVVRLLWGRITLLVAISYVYGSGVRVATALKLLSGKWVMSWDIRCVRVAICLNPV